MAPDPDWLIPDWPAPVRAVCTTRAGGVSTGPYASLNLGRPSGDDAAAVDANRQRLASAGVHPRYMSQVHGVDTVVLDGAAMQDTLQADACVTALPDQVCTVRIADCLPVLLADAGGRAVGAAHAGWRGLAAGVIERCCEALLRVGRERGLTATSGIQAWLGPCIGPQAFEVGAEVRAAFLAHDAAARQAFVPKADGKWLADLQALARQRLQALGITQVYGNDGSAPWCTVGNPSRFFSRRRDSIVLGGSGRMAACIWIDGSLR